MNIQDTDHQNHPNGKRNKHSKVKPITQEKKKYQEKNIESSESSDEVKKPINNCSLKKTSNAINQATIKNYKLLKTIGKGLYSKVKLAASKNHSNQFYAIKIIKRHHVEKVSLDLFQKILLNEVTLL